MFEDPNPLSSLLRLALSLGAKRVAGWSSCEEERVVSLDVANDPLALSETISQIDAGNDPLGNRFTSLLSNEQRRPLGATYTPKQVVDSMLDWAESEGEPQRIVDPGCGSARFLVAAARRFPNAQLVGIDIDPVATILARAHISAAGLGDRAMIYLGDFRRMSLKHVRGRTLFIGNPPYIRHHVIDPVSKAWLTESAKSVGIKVSQLAGSHIHFLLATAKIASAGDLAAYITSAEWLDVNYGEFARKLFLQNLGGTGIHVLTSSTAVFPGTQSTAAISTYRIGTRPEQIAFRSVDDVGQLDRLQSARTLPRAILENARTWSILLKPAINRRAGFVELGEICAVHRGQVTGANRIWIAGEHTASLPSSVLYPSVTKARELILAHDVLKNSRVLKCVVDIPVDFSGFDGSDRESINRFLDFARSQGADKSYVAQNRRAWWSVGLRGPAPILATYMARRKPAFVVNEAKARHINVAHGLYPKMELSANAISKIAAYLTANTNVSGGRTYAGGLTKFEPREMERIMIPDPSNINDDSWGQF